MCLFARRRPSPNALSLAVRAFSSPCADTAGAQAALGPHLSFGSRDTRGRCVRSIRGAGARESPPGVRRGHALPGAGAGGEATRLPSAAPRAGALLFPPPSGLQSPRLGPPPTLPHPGRRARARAKGPWPRRCALSPPLASSSRLVPGELASLGPSGRRAGATRAPRLAGPGKSAGAELAGSRSAASRRVRARSSPETPSFLSTGEGAGRALLWAAGRSVVWQRATPCAGSSRLCAPAAASCRPRCNVRPADTPSRLCRGSWPPARSRWQGPGAREVELLSRLESLRGPRRAVGSPRFQLGRWGDLEEARGRLESAARSSRRRGGKKRRNQTRAGYAGVTWGRSWALKEPL